MKLNEKIAASISVAALGTAMWAVPALACEPTPPQSPCPDGYTLKIQNLNQFWWTADDDYMSVVIGIKNSGSRTYDNVDDGDRIDPPGPKKITYVCVMPPLPTPPTTPTTTPTETTSPSPSYIEPSIHETTIDPTGSAEPTGSASPTPAETTDTQVLSAGPAAAVTGTPTYTG